MLKKLILILIFQSLAHICCGQGLVINGGADTVTSCIGSIDDLENIRPWYSPSNNSPDFYNECRLGGAGDVPNTVFSFQYAQNGTGFLGACVYPLNREYVCGKLRTPLVQGQTYCLSFYLILSDQQAIVIDRIGAYFSTDSIFYNTVYTLPVVPQLETSEGVFFPDTANWMQVSFEYLAQGGERFLTIGNFRDDSTTHHYGLDTSMVYSCAYYFIDAVDLVECKGSGVEEKPTAQVINVYPNPASSAFNIQYNLNTNATFELYSIDGKKLNTVQLQGQSGSYTYSTEALSNGVYLYAVRGAKGIMATGKLVLIK